MSKSDKRPKKTKIKEQLELFGDAEKAISQTTSGTSRGDMRAELLSRLRYQRSLTTNLMDKISSYGSLGKAYQQVKRNQGRGIERSSSDWIARCRGTMAWPLIEQQVKA
ncbi:MAG: hypothetical protein C7N36_13970 [Bacteroidetes bacterium]|nr:MAG: hypothetical protein C7N36_13970 [Bacteroidota bacterium]